MESKEIIDRFCAMADDLGSIVEGQTHSGSQRTALAVTCIHQALEHFDAIGILCLAGRCGSAAALVRPLVDAATRGVWLAVAASDDQARNFAEEGRLPERPKLISSITEKAPWIDSQAFSVDSRNWNHLHGLTHTGFNQLSQRLSDGKLSGDYRPEFVDGMLKFSVRVGAWATIVLGTLAAVPDVKSRVVAALERNAWYALG